MNNILPKKIIEHTKPTLGEEELNSIQKVFETNFIIEGSKTLEFENKLTEFSGSSGAICMPSGFLSLFLSIIALGGNELNILMPSFVCREVYDAIKMAGAVPILCDINLDFNIDISDVKNKLAKKNYKKYAAIIPHMFGLPANLEALLELDIPIIEDCAHSIGAKYKKQLTGTIGDIGIYSFEATKMITTGLGGAIISKDSNLIEKIRRLKKKIPLSNSPQYHFYLSDLQSSLGIVQLKRLPEFIKKRKKIAELYLKDLRDLPIILPQKYKDREHVFYRFFLGSKWKSPEEIIEKASKYGFRVTQYVKGLHRELSMPPEDFPITEEVLNHWVSIPIYPLLTNTEYNCVINGIKTIFRE